MSMSMSHRKSAMENNIDPSNGYCSADGVFYSLRKLEANVPVEMKGGATEFVLKRPRREGSVALVEAATGDEITYGELRKSVGAVAAGLRRLGVGKGDVVLVVSRNFLHFPALALAVMSTGALLSTANPLNNSLEIQKQMEDSNPVLVFTTTDQLHKFEGTVTRIVIIGPEGEYSGHLSLSGLFNQKPGGKRDASISATDAAVVMYSSGTTGKSKGVVCTHRNLMAMTASLSSVIESPLDVYLCFIPFFHIYGFVILCGVLAVGGTVVISSNFTVESMLMATAKYRVSHISTVPTVITRLCKSPGVGRRYDLSCLKQVLVGGAAMGKEQMDTFKTLFPTIGILQVYGLTETTGATIWSKGDDSRHYGSAGILLPNLEAKIVDVHNGNPLPPNAKGELCLRGHVVMQGYYNNNKATSSVIDSQGWFHTGDICYINHRGRVYVVDRIKELIKYKGQQVAPAELEELLLCNSKIEDAAVIPYPNEDAGEIPMALIVKKHGSNITAQDAIDFVTTKVAPYKKIRRVAFVESIPRSPSGKILRKHLKTQILHQNVISRL